MKVSGNKIKTIIVCIILALCFTGGAIAALGFSVQSIVKGYPLKITSSFVMFTINGNNYLSGVKSEDIKLGKGEQVDVTVEVGIESESSAYVDYRLYFEVEKTEGSTDAFNALTDAIEVYVFNGRKYEYLCRLSEISDKQDEEPVYYYSGELSTEFVDNINYRFVYSPETSAEYDDLAKDGKFVIKAFADEMAFSSTESQKYIYVSDPSVFETVFESNKAVGKTIILNSNIEISKDLTSNGKLSVNLNGYTLNTNGHNLTVTVAGTDPEEDFIPSIMRGMRIVTVDDVTSEVYGEITSGGKFVLPTELCLVDKPLKPNVTVSFSAAVLNEFNNEVTNRLKQLDGGKLYNYGEDVSFIFDGLEYLIGNFAGEVVTDGAYISLAYDANYTADGFVKIVYSDGKFIIDDTDAASKDVTTRYSINLNFAYNGNYANSYANVTLQGQSAYSIAQTLAAALPSVIDRSYLLKVYDTATAAAVEWIVYDGFDGLLFNGAGIYRTEGITELKNAFDDADENYYENVDLEIYLKVSKGVDTCIYTVTGVKAKPFTASEITSFIYDDVAITVGSDKPYNFEDHINNEAEWFGRVGFDCVEVTFLVGDDGHNASKYLEQETEDGYVTLTTTDEVKLNFVGQTKIKVKFNYENGDFYQSEYEVNLIGEAKYITSYDVSATLQADFNANPYVNGEGYEFSAKSVLMPSVTTAEGLKQVPVFVDYEVSTEEAKQFISITYDYVKVTDTSKMDDFYAYFTYNEVTGGYELAEKNSDGVYVGSEFFERLAHIEILPARVIYDDVQMVEINAVLYTLDTSDEASRHCTVGTVGDKWVKGTPYTTTHEGNEVNAYYDIASNTTTYLCYPLALEIDGVITNNSQGVPDYNLYSYLLTLYDGVKSGSEDDIITVKEANATWEEVLANLERKGLSDIVNQPVWYTNSYFTGNNYTKYDMKKKAISGGGIGGRNVSLEDFEKSPSTYANGTNNRASGYYLLKKTSANITSDLIGSNSWSALKNDNGIVKVPSDNRHLYMWDFIKVTPDENGLINYPDDYNLNNYLPGIYIIYFANTNATAPSGNVAYNRYVLKDGNYIHRVSAQTGDGNYYSNPTIIGPFERDTTYLKMDNISVSSLEGIGFFPHFKGISLVNSGITDLSPLSDLLELEYLNVSSSMAGVNTVTNLLPLKYLDSLVYLNIGYTNVTTLDDIRYLKSLKEINISNTSVTDFAALTDMPSIEKLTLTKSGLDNNNVDMYNLAVVSLSAGNFTIVNNDANFVIADEVKVAASVMRDLENFNRVNKILYLPLKYKYNGVDYDLRWFCSEESLIAINNETGGNFASFTINHPLFDTDLNINVQILNGASTYYSASRKFNVTLEAGTDETKYIYTSEGYRAIDTIVNDLVLRNLIFSTFNSGSETAVDVGGSSVNGKFVITEDELKDYRKTTTSLDWSGKGITDLTGIECLAPLFDQSDLYLEFNLANNNIDDLSPLTKLKLNILVLGGKEYDLSKLALNGENEKPLLTTLRALDVHECVNVSTEQSLEQLFEIYSNNPEVYIYKDKAPATDAVYNKPIYNDQDSAWNPYEELVEKELRKKQSVYTFVFKNESVNVFGTGSSFTFVMYGKEIIFNYSNNSVYQSPAVNCFSFSGTNTVQYSNMTAWEEAAVLKVVLSANDGHKAWTVSIGNNNAATFVDSDLSIIHDWYIELIALDVGKRINVLYNGEWVPASDLFASFDIMKAVYTWFFGGSGYTSKQKASGKEALTDNNYYIDTPSVTKETNFYIKSEFITKNFSTNEIKIVGKRISGEEVTYGLELLPSVTSLKFPRDLFVGDGSHMLNVTNITASSSSVDLSNVRSPDPSDPDASIALTELTISGFSAFNATEEGMSHLLNLKSMDLSYTSGTNQSEIIKDFSFLKGLITEFKYTVDSVEYTIRRTNLNTFKLKNWTSSVKTATEQLNADNWSNVYELYCAALVNYCYKAITTPGYTGSLTLATLATARPRQLQDAAEAYYNSLNSTQKTNNPLPNYRLKISQSNDQIKINEIGQLVCGVTTVYTPPEVLADAPSELEIDTFVTYTEQDGYDIVVAEMSDMGLKVNDVYWHSLSATAKFNVATGTVLTLPATTYNDWFGIAFDEDETKTQRAYNVSWKLYFSDGIGANRNAFTLTDLTSPTYTLSQNGYAVVVGTVSCEEKPSHSFVYHFIVGSGDGLYSNVSDRTLRLYLFAFCAKVNNVAAPEFTSIFYPYDADNSSNKGIKDTVIYDKLIARGICSAKLDKVNLNNYIYNLEGFSDVITAAGMQENITTVDLSGHKFLTVSELNCLTKLETLKLDNTDVKFTGYTTPATLKTFSIKNDLCFGLSDLAILTTPGKLESLNIYNTGVHALSGVLDELLKLTVADSDTITLAWANEILTSVSQLQIKSFKNIILGGTVTGYTSGFALSDFTVANEVGGVTVSLPANSYNLLNEFDIAEEVDTVLTAEYNANTQLFVYLPAKYRKSGANTGYVGEGTSDLASNYDTELLAYLYSEGYLVKSGNNNLVFKSGATTTCAIDTNIGIKPWVGGNTVAGVTVSVTSNTLMGPETQPAQQSNGVNPYNFTFSSASVPKVTNTTPQADKSDVVIDEATVSMFKTVPESITYFTDSYTLTVTIPRYVYISGKKYTVNVTANASNKGTFSYSGGVITFTFGNTLTLGAPNTIKYTVSLTPASGTAYSKECSFIVTRLDAGAANIEADEDNFLIEVQYSSAENLVYMVDSHGVRTITATVTEEPKKLYVVIDGETRKYYHEEPASYNETIYVVNASVFIASGRLRTYMYWLAEFNGETNANYKPFSDDGTTVRSGTLYEGVLKRATGKTVRYGKVLLNAYALKLVDFRVALEKGFGTTSLEGVQMFANTTSVLLFHNAFTDITPLSNMHLKSFQDINSQPAGSDENYFQVPDFMPLLKGSWDTLEEFAYNGYGNVYAVDLSFLTGCPNLKKVYIGTRTHYDSSDEANDGNAFTYFRTLPAQYVIASLYNRGVNIYISKDTTRMNAGLLTLDETRPYTWTSYYGKDQVTPGEQRKLTISVTRTLYPIIPKSYDMQAANVLGNLSDAQSPDRSTTYSTFKYGYLYDVTTHPVVAGSTSRVTAYIPATINYNGEISFIDWKSVTSNIKEIVYVKKEDSTETIMTAEATAEYIASMEYYNAQKAGRAQVYAKITVDVGDVTNVSACDYTRLTCNITIEGAVYQRLITLNFS